jgi:hypothetical protein
MCITCGCKQYEDDHDDARNITLSDLRRAAEAAELDIEDVTNNIDEAVLATSGAGAVLSETSPPRMPER